jgi:hypothetical protein
VTLLGKKKKKSKIQSTSDMSDDDKTKGKEDRTGPFNPKNINHPTSIEELPDELHRKIQAKLDANLKAFLESCTKDQRDKVPQFCEPNFSDSIASTSAALEVKVNEKVDDPYPNHANYAKMLQDQRTVSDNNLMTLANMLFARMDRLEVKTADDVDPSMMNLLLSNPNMACLIIFYDNQSLYAMVNKAKLACSTLQTDKANLGGITTTLPMVTFASILAHNARADHGPAVNRASARYNMVLPNLSKSPSQIPMLSSVPVASITDFNGILNRFKDELSKSIKSSLGVQIKPSRITYHKPYPSHFDFLKALDGGGY